MRTVKISRGDKVKCSRENALIPVEQCRKCNDLFGIVPHDKVLCKRGINQDEYLKRDKYIKSGRYSLNKGEKE